MAAHSPKSPIVNEVTKGKTHENRLRRIDILIVKLFPDLFCNQIAIDQHTIPTMIDIGYGDKPTTFLQSAARFHSINSNIRMIGTEIDNNRVRHANEYIKHCGNITSDNICCVKSGFNLKNVKIDISSNNNINSNSAKRSPNSVTTCSKHTIRYIRCMNVLRQSYEESKVQSVHSLLCSQLSANFESNLNKQDKKLNSILCEGTTDKYGRFWCVNLFNQCNQCVAVVFGTNFKQMYTCGKSNANINHNYKKTNSKATNYNARTDGSLQDNLHPSRWQPFLPKNFIHRLNVDRGMEANSDRTKIYSARNDKKCTHSKCSKKYKNKHQKNATNGNGKGNGTYGNSMKLGNHDVGGRDDEEKFDETEAVNEFFKEWKYYYNKNIHVLKMFGNEKVHFVQTVLDLSKNSQTFVINGQKSLIKRGFLVWYINGKFNNTNDVLYAKNCPKRKNKVR